MLVLAQVPLYCLGAPGARSPQATVIKPSPLLFPPQDEDEEVYKRDFSAPTLEDHFNKTILPKVMQVQGSGGEVLPY